MNCQTFSQNPCMQGKSHHHHPHCYEQYCYQTNIHSFHITFWSSQQSQHVDWIKQWASHCVPVRVVWEILLHHATYWHAMTSSLPFCVLVSGLPNKVKCLYSDTVSLSCCFSVAVRSVKLTFTQTYRRWAGWTLMRMESTIIAKQEWWISTAEVFFHFKYHRDQ